MARTPRNHVHVSSNSSTSRHAREREHAEPELEPDREERTLLEAYMVLAAQLKARLLDTQDEKNLLAQKHAQELSDARDAWERLQFRYERSRQEVRMVKKERDELKEGFEILLQKVEICNNFSSWPFPRIHLSSVVAEAIPPERTLSGPTEAPNSSPYTPSMISRLVKERDEALAERDLLVRESAAKFSMLEAQLALREAELLSLQNENELNRTIRSSRSTSDNVNSNSNSHQPTLSSDDAIRILQYNAAKNRSIQSDVKKLRKRLEIAREKPSEAGPSIQTFTSPAPQIPPQPEPGSVVKEFAREVQDLASKLDSLQLEKARLLAEIAEENATAMEIEADKHHVNRSRSQSNSGPPCNSCEVLLEENLKLKAQLLEVQRRPPVVCDPCKKLQEENARLQARVRELQQTTSPVPQAAAAPSSPPQHSPASNPTRESPSFSQQPSTSIPTPPSPQLVPLDPPIEDDNGELSMELATPLFPSTVVLPPTSSRNSSSTRSSHSQLHSTSSSSSPSVHSHDSHPSLRWDSPSRSVSIVLSPFGSSEGMEGDDEDIVDIISPAAAASLLIDSDEGEDEGEETLERRRRLEAAQDLSRSQFRLSELALDYERDRESGMHHVRDEDDNDNDNDVTARPSNFLRTPSPPVRTPRLENLERGDVIDEVRDILLELMPDLGR